MRSPPPGPLTQVFFDGHGDAMVVGVAAFAAYLATMAPTITWGNGASDGPELAAAAYVWGVAHPPGYPLYLTVVRLMQTLPVGDAAFRANLVSAVSMAVAAVLLNLVIRLLLSSAGHAADSAVRMAAAFGSASFAAAPLVWGQATVTDIYGFEAALTTGFLFVVLRWLRSPTSRRLMVVAGVLGLLIGHHPPYSVLLLPLAWLAWRQRQPARVYGHAVLVLALVIVVPFLTLLLRAELQPALNWGDPRTLDGFLTHVTARIYQPYVLAQPLAGELASVYHAGNVLERQEGWLWLGLAALGTGSLWRAQRPFSLIATTLATFFFLQSVIYNVANPDVYLIPAVAILAIAAAVGLHLPLSTFPSIARRSLAAGLITWFGWTAVSVWPQVNVSQDRTARDWGETVLQSAPPAGVVHTTSDRDTFVLWYLQAVDHERSDVAVVADPLVPFAWYRAQLVRSHPSLVVFLAATPSES